MPAPMSNGWLVSPSAVRTYVPGVATLLKSISCTFRPAVGSTPRGVVVPDATEVPPDRSSHVTGSVSVVTSVACLGPCGR